MLQEIVQAIYADDDDAPMVFGAAEARERVLCKLLHPDQPFGPVASPEIDDREIFDRLFDRRNSISEGLRKGPAMIIGRRGAGKTAFLNSFHFDPAYDVVVSLQSDDSFPKMVRTIEGNLPVNVLAEEVSLLWTNLLWGAVFAALLEAHRDEAHDELADVTRYLEGIGVRQGMTPYRIMRTILKAIEAMNEKFKVLIDTIEEMAPDGVTFAEAQAVATRFLDRRGLKAIVLIDSLEQFPLDEPSMANALTGLLRAVGRFNQPGQPCQIRCCLPSELYPRLITLSSNPLKDFASHIVLSWQPHELFHLAALRYASFLGLYFPAVYERRFKSIDLTTRKGVRRFWQQVLPNELSNEYGLAEDTLAYLMRHTQLLPRHLLLHLNAIAKRTLSEGDDSHVFAEAAVLAGVRDTEHMIVEEIFNGYKQVYPQARALCRKLLPNLAMRFELGEFHKQFNRNRKSLEDVVDYHDALAVLMEIGAVGVVTGDNERYIEGAFGYALPNRLHHRADDRFCVHPIFVREYRVPGPAGEAVRPIYPSGSEVELR